MGKSNHTGLLRCVQTSGGLLTENILLQLRDNPERFQIGKIESLNLEITAESKKKFSNQKRKIFEWAISKWDDIELKIEKMSIEEINSTWLIPFFQQLDYDFSSVIAANSNLEVEFPYKEYKMDFKPINQPNPIFKFVSLENEFDEKNPSNPDKISHHNICQFYLNSNSDTKWIILSNGKTVRLLTKYFYSFSKGFIQFNLETMFSKRDWYEFNIFYNIIHPTRFTEYIIKKESNSEGKSSENHFDGNTDNNENSIDDSDENIEKSVIPLEISVTELSLCMLDEFLKESQREGIKIGDLLRDNVHDAIELLGNELIQQNLSFLVKIKNNEVDSYQYYSEMLRIVYRLIFLLYAEQRDMMPPSDSLFFRHFSLSSLRILAEKPLKNDKNYDLWEKLHILFKMVRNGEKFLMVPCFNGKLFDDKFGIPIIKENHLHLSNIVLLRVIRYLTISKTGNIRQRINFREVSEEEIGTIYESLLDYCPLFNDKYEFVLPYQTSERKSTGSYYTPKSLIDYLIRTSLAPCLNEKLDHADKNPILQEKALLDLKICDPACGGGTFLLSALDFLGEKLAYIKHSNPTEEDLRHARREVLQNCIFGVDKNPLAVELAKISLWLRACVKDKPLNFLDNHIKCGNSLIGFVEPVKDLVIEPKFYTFSNKTIQNKIRKQIQEEIPNKKKSTKKVSYITSFITNEKSSEIDPSEFQQILKLPEESPLDLQKKDELYKKLKENKNFIKNSVISNAWISTFFWDIENEINLYPNNTFIGELKNDIIGERNSKIIKNIQNLSNEFQFFNWFLEFPEVFNKNKNGFDCIISNPPWEMNQANDNEFFQQYSIHFSKQSKKDKKEIKKNLLNDIIIEKKYQKYNDLIEMTNSYWIQTFKLQIANKFNLYKLFLEKIVNITNSEGYIGVIIPAGIFGEERANLLRLTIVKTRNISNIVQFFSSDEFFPNIASGQPLSLLSFKNSGITSIFKFKSNIKATNELYDENNSISIPASFLFQVSPNFESSEALNIESLSVPFIQEKSEFKILEKLLKNPKIAQGWELDSHRELNRTDDEKNGIIASIPSKLPVLEGKHLVYYGYSLNNSKLFIQNIDKYVEYKPDFQYERIVWRNVSNFELKRRMFVALIPPNTPTVNSLNYLTAYKTNDSKEFITREKKVFLTGMLGSLVAEYIIRLFSSNNNLNQYLIKNVPIPLFDKENVFHIKLVTKMEQFFLRSSTWAERMFLLEKDFKQKNELEKEYWDDLSDIDALTIKIYDLSKDELDLILKRFTKIDLEYKKLIKLKIEKLN